MNGQTARMQRDEATMRRAQDLTQRVIMRTRHKSDEASQLKESRDILCQRNLMRGSVSGTHVCIHSHRPS